MSVASGARWPLPSVWVGGASRWRPPGGKPGPAELAELVFREACPAVMGGATASALLGVETAFSFLFLHWAPCQV